jgi:hypothetical protein
MDETSRRQRNEQKLAELYPTFRARIAALIVDLEDRGIRPRIQDAWRSPEAQLAAFQSGHSKLKYGFHNVTGPDGGMESLAVDLLDDTQPSATQAQPSFRGGVCLMRTPHTATSTLHSNSRESFQLLSEVISADHAKVELFSLERWRLSPSRRGILFSLVYLERAIAEARLRRSRWSRCVTPMHESRWASMGTLAARNEMRWKRWARFCAQRRPNRGAGKWIQ